MAGRFRACCFLGAKFKNPKILWFTGMRIWASEPSTERPIQPVRVEWGRHRGPELSCSRNAREWDHSGTLAAFFACSRVSPEPGEGAIPNGVFRGAFSRCSHRSYHDAAFYRGRPECDIHPSSHKGHRHSAGCLVGVPSFFYQMRGCWHR